MNMYVDYWIWFLEIKNKEIPNKCGIEDTLNIFIIFRYPDMRCDWCILSIRLINNKSNTQLGSVSKYPTIAYKLNIV